MKEELKLLENSSSFKKLKDFYNKSDFALHFGVSRSETKHSNFQAWIFDPKSDHDLHDMPIRYLLESLVDSYPLKEELKKTIKSKVYSITSINVYREKHNIDLLLTFKVNEFMVNIVVENKIYAGLSDTQLSKYKGIVEKDSANANNIYLYLHPNFNEEVGKANKDGYISLTYQQFYENVLKPSFEYSNDLKTQIALDSYIHCLATPISNDNGIIITDAERTAIEDLFTNYKDIISQNIESLIQNDNKIFTTIFYKCLTFNVPIDNELKEKMSKAFNKKLYFFKGKKCTGIRKFVIELFNYLINEEHKTYNDLIEIIKYDGKNKLIATKEEVEQGSGVRNKEWYLDHNDYILLDNTKYLILNGYNASDYFFIVNKVKETFPDLDF